MRMCLALALSAMIAVPALAQPRQPGGGMMGMMGGGVTLNNASVQAELKLTDEQKTKIKEFGEKARKEMTELFQPGGDREKMQEAMTKMRAASEKFNKETLTSEQAKRLKEITLQVGGVLAAVRNEDAAKALKFTDEQKEKFKEISDQLNKDRREMFQGGGGPPDADTLKKIAALGKEAADKAAEALTSEQKATWKEMTGKPFEFKADAPMRRPGGGDRPGGGGRPGRPGGADKKDGDKKDK